MSNPLNKSLTMALAATATSDFTSFPFPLEGLKDYSLHVKFSSATLNGTLKLQASNDPTAATAPSSADWVDVADSSQTVTSGASHIWNVSSSLYETFCFVWTHTSGTGTLTAWLQVKYIGG